MAVLNTPTYTIRFFYQLKSETIIPEQVLWSQVKIEHTPTHFSMQLKERPCKYTYAFF